MIEDRKLRIILLTLKLKSKNLKFESFRENPKTIAVSDPPPDYNKRLGMFKKIRPKTPAAPGRNIKTKPKRAFSAKQRRSTEKIEPASNKYHKLFTKLNINSIQVS